MHAYPETIVCKFGGDPAICVREEAICTKVYRQTDDGRRTIALAHAWNELIMTFAVQLQLSQTTTTECNLKLHG